jgi:hypothetical protein
MEGRPILKELGHDVVGTKDLLNFEKKVTEYSIRKVLRPATSTQVFLCFPVPRSKC